MTRLLAIDVGNLGARVGVYEGEKLIYTWVVGQTTGRTADELAASLLVLMDRRDLQPSDVADAVLASASPPGTGVWFDLLKKHFGLQPLVVGPGVKTGIDVRYENAQEVGADQIVTAVGAYSLYGGPLVTADFGTATTLGVLSETGQYLGGVICPGVGVSLSALFDQAAKLPRVQLRPPGPVLGRNTVASVRSGFAHGFAAMVEGLVGRIEAETGLRLRVVATGEYAPLVARVSDRIDVVDPHLSLEGLRRVYERNRSLKARS